MPLNSATHRLLSGPTAMPDGSAAGNSVTVPATVTWPRWAASSTYQRLPSGPATMLPGNALAVDSANSVTTPAGVILATLFVPVFGSVNHMLPSGPCTMANGPALAVGTGYSTIVPLGGLVGAGVCGGA